MPRGVLGWGKTRDLYQGVLSAVEWTFSRAASAVSILGMLDLFIRAACVAFKSLRSCGSIPWKSASESCSLLEA